MGQFERSYSRPCVCGQTDINFTGYCHPCFERGTTTATTIFKPQKKDGTFFLWLAVSCVALTVAIVNAWMRP